MIKRLSAFLLFSLFVFPAISYAEDTRIQRTDFAFGRNIKVTNESPAHRFELPEDVFKTVTRSDLGDIRIFNGSGREVPHEVVAQTPIFERTLKIVSLPFFPIRGGGVIRSNSAYAGVGSVEIRENSTGQVVEVRMKDGTKQSAEGPIHFLVDLRRLDKEIKALSLSWSAHEENHIVPLSITSSEDLSNWQPVSSSVVVAKLDYLGEQIERNKIELTLAKTSFLKISAAAGVGFKLTGLLAEYSTTKEKSPHEYEITAIGTIDPKNSRAVNYDVGGFIPAARFQLSLPEKNTVLRFRLLSRNADTENWTERFTGTSHRLSRKESEIESPARPLRANVLHRFWRMESQGRDVTVRETLPLLKLRAAPYEVRFLAQGDGPFEIVYGSALATPADFGQISLTSNLSESEVSTPPVELGERHLISGENALSIPIAPYELPWKKWLLWGVLGVFLIGVATMTFRLFQDLKNNPPAQ